MRFDGVGHGFSFTLSTLFCLVVSVRVGISDELATLRLLLSPHQEKRHHVLSATDHPRHPSENTEEGSELCVTRGIVSTCDLNLRLELGTKGVPRPIFMGTGEMGAPFLFLGGNFPGCPPFHQIKEAAQISDKQIARSGISNMLSRD